LRLAVYPRSADLADPDFCDMPIGSCGSCTEWYMRVSDMKQYAIVVLDILHACVRLRRQGRLGSTRISVMLLSWQETRTGCDQAIKCGLLRKHGIRNSNRRTKHAPLDKKLHALPTRSRHSSKTTYFTLHTCSLQPCSKPPAELEMWRKVYFYTFACTCGSSKCEVVRI
jgi:hypothetical protein